MDTRPGTTLGSQPREAPQKEKGSGNKNITDSNGSQLCREPRVLWHSASPYPSSAFAFSSSRGFFRDGEAPWRLLSTRWCCRGSHSWRRARFPRENQTRCPRPRSWEGPQGETRDSPYPGPQQEEVHRPGHEIPFRSDYREHGEPQLSRLLVFSGQHHSACGATAGTRVRPSPVRHPPQGLAGTSFHLGS